MADRFDTQDLAAVAALAACKREIERSLECGTGIYRGADGGFYYTPPQAAKNNSINGMVLRFPANATLTAMAHTHPAEPLAGGGDTSDAFSGEDVRYAKKTGLGMYLGSEKSGRVTRLTPKSRSGSRGRKWGEDVGAYGDETQALVTALRKPQE